MQQKHKLGVVRPTTSKVLESLMATLEPYLEGARVLDLFAGTGSVGLAAHKLGANEVVFVEGHPKLAAALRARIPAGCSVLAQPLPGGLSRLTGTFDLILADPPYGSPDGPATLAALGQLLATDAWVVVEHHHKDNYPDRLPGLSLERRRRFGETALSYYRAT